MNEIYQSENGLPVGNVNQVYQTPDGFIWMATYDGLVRFDGQRYKVYLVSEYPNLTSNRLVTIQKGIGNSFWLTTEQGKLVRYRNANFRTFSSRAEHQRVIIDGDSLEWVLGSQGLKKIIGDSLIAIQAPNKEEMILSFIRFPNGDVHLGSSSGTVYKTKFPYRELIREFDLPQEVIARGTWLDNHGNAWYFNRKVLSRWNEEWKEPNNLELVVENWTKTPPLFFSLNQIPGGDILVSAETGLFILKDKHIIPLNAETKSELPTEAERISGTTCKCANGDLWAYSDTKIFLNGKYVFDAIDKPVSIYCDRENNIWVVPWRNGIQRFRKSNLTNYLAPDGFKNYYGVYKDLEGRIWFGEQYLHLYYLQDDSVYMVESRLGLGSTAVFLESGDGRFYVGNRYWDPQDSRQPPTKFEEFIRVEGVDDDVNSIFEADDSSIWFGTRLNLFRLKNNRVDTIQLPGEYYPVRFMIQDRNKTIWMATNGGGVFTFNPNTEKWNHYDKTNGLPSNNIRALLEKPDGNIWIASEDAGLAHLNKQTGQLITHTTDDGLYQNGIHSLIEDDSGRLWMSTNQGLFYVQFENLEKRLKDKKYRLESVVYTERNGMLNREANGGFQNSGFVDKEGVLWFPTQEGIVSVNPKNRLDSEINFNLNIVNIQVGDSSLKLQDSSLHLTKEQSDLRISYTCPTFIAPARIHYSYMLEGFDDNWRSVDNGTEAVFTNLPGGKYTFWVKANLDANDKPIAETSFDLIKEPRFFERTIFYVLLAILIITGFYIIYRVRLRQLKRHKENLEMEVKLRTSELEIEKQKTEAQKEELIRLDQEKNTYFSNIAHEFRTPLTLIMGPLEELQDVSNKFPLAVKANMDRALRNTERLQKLVEQLMDLARLEAGKLEMHFKRQPIVPFINSIARDYMNLAESGNISFKINQIDEHILVEFDEYQLDKVFHNLLSNAFKFTPEGGEVNVHVYLKDGKKLYFEIADTGPGIDQENTEHLFERFYQVEKSELQPGSGLGLNLAREICRLHGGDVFLKETSHSGSVFSVTLPVQEVLPHQKVQSGFEEVDDINDSADLKCILVIDDNDDIRNYLKDSLESDYRVLLAGSGNQGWAILKEELPDLIISDVMMPNGDGLELLKKIRADKNLAFLPVILLTAKSEVSDRLEGLSIGADDYITKPFNMKALKARVHNIFEQRMRLRSWFESLNSRPEDLVKVKSLPYESRDTEWLKKLSTFLSDHLGDENLTVTRISDFMAMDRTGFYRKLNELTDESPQAMITRLRMERAAEGLRNNIGTVSEVAYSCGFSSLAHFSRTFKKYFGRNPSEYLKDKVNT